MSSIHPKSDAVLLEGAGLRVVFELQGDRFSHTVGLTDANGFQPLLKSVEGSPEEDWPASPALQQLSVERRGGSQIALLVGMSGRSHWSLSVELDAVARRISFDAACRVHASPPALASSYAMLAPAEPISGLVRLGPGDWQLGSEGAAATIHAAVLAIRPSAMVSPLPFTLRWRYSIFGGGEA